LVAALAENAGFSEGVREFHQSDRKTVRLPMRVRPWLVFELIVLSAIAACFAPGVRADEPAKTQSVTAGPLKLAVPEAWKQKEVTSRFRLAQFTIPKVPGDAEDAEFVVYFFGAGGGGGPEANLDRWIKQFQTQERKVKLTSGKSTQGEFILADVSGTWNKPIGPPIAQKTKEMPGARALSIILTGKDQNNYFLRLTGPDKTVAANADALRAAIGADAKSEKAYALPESSGN
jgi:gluconolactonase